MRTNRRKTSATLTKIMSSITEEERRRTRDRMLIAVKIDDALKTMNLSQKDFAKLMGRSESEISEWLSGNRNFTVDTLSDISHCLNICLFTNSEIQTTSISTSARNKKIKKTHSPTPYIISGYSVFVYTTGDCVI